MNTPTARVPLELDGFLSELADDVFGYLPRADQRRWAYAYLNGLLGGPGKKTVQQMARTIPTGINPSQGLQQFINSSPWDWTPARRSLADMAARFIPLQAWTVGILGIPKRGEHSVGVHRRFLPHLGRTVNCQVAIGLFHSAETHSTPIDWRLFLDGLWSNDEVRRQRARIPEAVSSQPVCMEVLGLVDTILSRDGALAAPLVVDLRIAVDAGRLAGELTARGVDFVMEVNSAQPVLPSPGLARGDSQSRLRQSASVAEMWRHDGLRLTPSGDGRPGRPRTATVSVRAVGLPGALLSGASEDRVYRLLTRRPSESGEPHRYWITSIADRPAAEILALARHTARAEAVMTELEVDLGALDFEGRSFPGWHHHMTMVSAAHLYRTVASRGVRRISDPLAYRQRPA